MNPKPKYVADAEACEDSARAFARQLRQDFPDRDDLALHLTTLEWEVLFDLYYMFGSRMALDLYLTTRWRDERKPGLAGYLAVKLGEAF